MREHRVSPHPISRVDVVLFASGRDLQTGESYLYLLGRKE